MPSFTFQGFFTGTSVAISANQGSNSRSGSVSTWNETGGIGGNLVGLDIQIVEQSSSMTAPAMVCLRAVPGAGFQLSSPPANTPYEPWRHEITYIWRVRNNPLTFERAPHLNMPDAWKDANVYYGPEVIIVFDAADTYEIDLVAVDRHGNYGEASLEGPTALVVGAANDTFPGGATIAVSAGSDFTGAAPGATTINLGTQTWADVNAAIAARGNSGTRVSLRAGVDFRSLVAVGEQFDLGGITSNEVMIDSFGTGAKPIFPLPKNTGLNQDDILFRLSRDNTGDAKFVNIDMRGGWEADKERGYIGASPLWRDIQVSTLFHRCRISGHNTIETQFRNGDCHFIWSDGEITNWADMGLYLRGHAGGAKRWCVIGSDIHQHEDARQGTNKNGFQNQHGGIRCEDNDNLHLHVVDLFSRNGWSTGFSSASADQPCLRVNSNGAANAKTIGDRVAMEGGYQVLKIAGQDPGASTPDTPGNHLFDKLLTVGTPETQYHVECKMGGTTIRNALSVEFDVPKFSGGIRTGMYDFRSDDTVVPANNQTPVATYNCTFVSLLSSANNQALSSNALENVVGVLDGETFGNFDDVNNISYMPNQNAPVGTPVDLAAMAGVTPRFKGTAESIVNVQATGTGADNVLVPYSALPDKNGNATNQAFWLARASAGSTKHQVRSNGDNLFSDLPNNLSVTYEAGGARLQRLDGGTFGNGAGINLKLDQSDTLDPPDPAYSLTGQSIPVATLLSQANAVAGFIAADRFGLGLRPGSGLPGAPAGTPRQGAV